MKKLFSILMSAVCVVLLAACSSDDEPKWEDKYPDVDKQLVDGLKSSKMSECYTFCEMENFVRPDKDSEWEPIDEWLIGWTYAPGRIYINDGKVLTSLQLRISSMGRLRAEIASAWDAYRSSAKVDEKLYLYTVFEPDMDDMTLTMGSKKYQLDLLSSSKMEITEIVDDQTKIKYNYEATEFSSEEKSKIVALESLNAAYQYIIDKARGYFGDIIDLNKVYGGAALDYPIIDLNELQRELDNNNIR